VRPHIVCSRLPDTGGAKPALKSIAPTRDTLTQFLLFQIAARDTGRFPDIEKVRILQ